MKEFSHPGGKNQELIDINKTIQSTITVASNEWKYVADVETDFDEAMPTVPCMPQEISQVVLNLIVNAAHAIGGVLEEGSAAKGKITITTTCTADRAEIRIADTGGGIPDHIKERVFDPFFTTKDVGKGTGQGLTMAYKTIVNGHKGNLSFDVQQGEGTTFLISLPLDVDVDEPMQVVA
jgi:signal transduction histidine kinase